MEELSLVYKALSDGTRLRVLNLLLEAGELCVCDIESTLRCTQTKISRHMGYLRRAGLTRDRKSGRWVYYSVAKPQTESRRLILRNLREQFAADPRAGEDRAALQRLFSSGCCATLNQKRSTRP